MEEVPLSNNLKGKQNLLEEKNRKTKNSNLKVNKRLAYSAQDGEKSSILI